ncbi:MAG: hypothetical protein JXR76_31760 [Deltaproteobacteria bacterium]|nr:hypothetical protein [Deltaproteobacteria bacterium]
MDTELTNKLSNELRELGGLVNSQLGYPDVHPAIRDSNICSKLTEKTIQVVDFLVNAPHAPAKIVAQKMGMSREEIKLAYKLIQASPELTERFRSSPNNDYLNIVRHYFNTEMYVVVFFVGMSCPGRCIYCPNVTVRPDGSRFLSVYRGRKDTIPGAKTIARVFDDLDSIRLGGVLPLVKISGGLEPLTDPETMSLILDEAEEKGIRVKLFTNGLLLNTPERRRLALRASDIRISLNVLDEHKYDHIMFGKQNATGEYSLTTVLSNIGHMVNERDRLGLNSKIGLNTIVLEENHKDIVAFTGLAKNLGLDFIDFKPNYFQQYSPETQAAVCDTITRLHHDWTRYHPDLFFAGSLFKENVFWTHREGVCHPHKQARFKMFITPFGKCSPVHHGAFPSSDREVDERYTVGQLLPSHGLIDVLNELQPLPDIEFDKLNPFEHMLALEIDREEQDLSWGIPPDYNPYNFPMATSVPPDFPANPVLKQIVTIRG